MGVIVCTREKESNPQGCGKNRNTSLLLVFKSAEMEVGEKQFDVRRDGFCSHPIYVISKICEKTEGKEKSIFSNGRRSREGS